MSESSYATVEVHTNIDSLSSSVLHDSLVRMIDNAAKHGAEFLRGAVPKRTGDMAAHVGSKEAHEIAGLVEAKIGISEVTKAGGYGPGVPYPGEQQKSHYPLFVDRGTGIFGPTHSRIFPRRGARMFYEEDGRFFAPTSTQGQRGQHFMAETFAFVEVILRTDQSIREALDAMAARATVEKL